MLCCLACVLYVNITEFENVPGLKQRCTSEQVFLRHMHVHVYITYSEKENFLTQRQAEHVKPLKTTMTC